MKKKIIVQDYFKYIIGLILILVLVASCGGVIEGSRGDAVDIVALSKGESKGDWKLSKRYYRVRRYDWKEKRYKFLKKDRLRESEIELKGYYYKTYYDLRKRLLRVDEVKFGRISKIERYFYKSEKDKKDEGSARISTVKKYLLNGALDEQIRYNEQGEISSQEKYDFEGKREYKVFVGFVIHGDGGWLEEKYQDRAGNIRYRIRYNLYGNRVWYEVYDDGLVMRVVYEYDEYDDKDDKKGIFLRKEKHYNGFGVLKSYEVYGYGENEMLRLSRKYVGGKKQSVVLYDKQGRVGRVQEYDRFEKVIWRLEKEYEGDSFFVKKVKVYKVSMGKKVLMEERFYDKQGKEKKRRKYFGEASWKWEYLYYYKENRLIGVREYNRSYRLRNRWEYTYNNFGNIKVKKQFKKGKLEEVIYNSYQKKDKLSRQKIFKGKKLVKVLYYDKLGREIKIEFGESGKLVRTFLRKYNRRDQLAEQLEKGKTGQVEQYTLYTYKNGLKVQEDGYDGRRQYLGSIRYKHHEGGMLKKLEYYNYKRELTRVAYFDKRGNLLKGSNR